MADANKPTSQRRKLMAGIGLVLLGVAVEYATLITIDHLVTDFPRVPDLLMDRLPLIQFGWIGEAFFFGLVTLYCWRFFRAQTREAPTVFIAIGTYYIVRAVFLLFLPIGSPSGAPPIDDRLNVWGFANHAYFPGGHVGILTILTLSLRDAPWRRWLWAGVVIFAAGSLLNKTHYTADSIGGILLGAGVWTWIQRKHRS